MKVIKPASGYIGAEILDLDITSVGATEIDAIKQLIYAHKLIIFREQDINVDEYINFARKLGIPQEYPQKHYQHPDYSEIYVSSNVPKDGNKFGVKETGKYWHTDCAFLQNPLPLTMLKPEILPKSVRKTYYIDMQQIYQKLPTDLKTYVDNNYVINEVKWRYKVQAWDIDKSLGDIMHKIEQKYPAVQHPAVITHPVTKQKSLYISSGFTTGIAGLDYETNQEVLHNLFSFVEDEEHIQAHTWQEGDIILWENRALNHKGGSVPEEEKSLSYRIGIFDDLPFYIS